MQRGLAYRRHHEERIKEQVRERLRVRNLRTDRFNEIDEREVGFLATTPKPCSCEMCGNPRRHFGKVTRQEIINRRGGRVV